MSHSQGKPQNGQGNVREKSGNSVRAHGWTPCTWFCYQLIAKPGNKTATVLWPDPSTFSIIHQCWGGTGSWSPSLLKTKTCLSCRSCSDFALSNIHVLDVLVFVYIGLTRQVTYDNRTPYFYLLVCRYNDGIPVCAGDSAFCGPACIPRQHEGSVGAAEATHWLLWASHQSHADIHWGASWQAALRAWHWLPTEQVRTYRKIS